MNAPHTDSYTKLEPSSKHGIGVFAFRRIPSGINIFNSGESPMVEVDESMVAELPLLTRKMYKAFCPPKGDKLICPPSFNALTIEWYLNHSKTPNVICDKDYNFISAKEIGIGEELLVDYTTYGEVNFHVK